MSNKRLEAMIAKAVEAELRGGISHSITTVAKDNYIIEIEDEED